MSDEIQSIENLLALTGAKKALTTDPHSAAIQFEEKMFDVRLKEKEMEAERQAQALHVPYIHLKGFPIPPEALRQIPREQAEALRVICFLFIGPEIRLATTHPENEAVKELLYQLEERHQARGGLYYISEESLRVGLKAYDTLPQIKKILKGVKITNEELEEVEAKLQSLSDVQTLLNQANVTDVLTIAIAASLKFGSSDIHVEAEQDKIAVRFRVDGVLQEIAVLPSELWKKMTARIKLISGLKINITNRPQDGRFTIFLKEGDADVRVSIIPTTWGESVVMRLLKPGSIQVDFHELGFRPLLQARLIKEIDKPHGMILTTGPTGSGKTTTLYAVLRRLNKSAVKIITLEDPIEYKLEGINQSQIDHSKNYTFATGLRSVLRQDPDVVMVGEIRDFETAEVAINAALTGHLMLSTLHTNDATGAIPRLLSMGVKPFLVAPALNAIIGQRLVRRVCEACKSQITLNENQLAFVRTALTNIPEASGEVVPPESTWTFFAGKGCAACNQSGFKGRMGIYEVLVMQDAIRTALTETLSEFEVRTLAKQQGMITLRQDGVLKALDGLTTVEEVIRVAGEN